MARDDYFVLAYRILAYLYACVKEGAEPDMEYLSYKDPHFDVHEGYWNYVIKHLYRDGHIYGIALVPLIGSKEPGIKYRKLEITPEGIRFLQENPTMSKAADFLRTLKDITPGL